MDHGIVERVVAEKGNVVDPVERDAILEDILLCGPRDLGPRALEVRVLTSYSRSELSVDRVDENLLTGTQALVLITPFPLNHNEGLLRLPLPRPAPQALDEQEAALATY